MALLGNNKPEKDVMVEVNNLHKSFRLPHEKHSSLKQAALSFGKQSFEEFKVLKDIDFKVKKNEFFGIVGRNGSGKSTLLKTIAGIYHPSKGGVKLNGQLTPFIELGVGFNMELSGRDNVFLNGAIFGLSRRETAKLYPKIVKFAELEKFMDQKLKNYSSGMQVRLAFSIAIQAQNEILLIDEVLAVGDSNFQKKCFDFFEQIKGKKTVIFVSHDMRSVERFCDRVMILEKSEIVDIGKPQDMIFRYGAIMANEDLAMNKDESKKSRGTHLGSGEAVIEKIDLLDKVGKPTNIVKEGAAFGFKIRYKTKKNKAITKPAFHLSLFDDKGTKLITANTEKGGQAIDKIQGSGSLMLDVKQNPLAAGQYKLNAGIFAEKMAFPYDHFRDAMEFKVIGSSGVGDARLAVKTAWGSPKASKKK